MWQAISLQSSGCRDWWQAEHGNFSLFFVTFKQIINLSHETRLDICIEDNIRYDVNKNDLIERDVTVYRRKIKLFRLS